MIPIKIHCGCGQKYAFESDPADALVDQIVRCPVCDADGTAAARNQVAKHATPPAPRKLGLRPGELSRSVQPPEPVHRELAHAQATLDNRRTKNWLVPAIVGGVVVMAVVGVLVARSQGQKRVADSPIASAADGFPQTLAQVQAWYVEPESGHNGAKFFQQGFDALQLRNVPLAEVPIFGKSEIPAPSASLSAASRSAISALLRSNRAAIQHFTEGAKFEQSHYAVDLSHGCDTIFRHLAQLKNALVVMELAALFHADTQDSKQAVEDIETCLALADSVKDEPAILSQVVRTFGVSRAIVALEQSLNRTCLSSGSLARLAASLRRMEESYARGEGFDRALAAERVNDLALLAEPEKILQALNAPGSKFSPQDKKQLAHRLEKQLTLQPEAKFFQNALQRILAARKKDFPDRLKSDLVAYEEMTLAKNKKLTALQLLLPSFTGRATQEAESLAELRLSATAVALEQYRRAHDNRYPDALAALSPEYFPATPVDPFQGRILVYEKKGSGYVLSSPEPESEPGKRERIRPGPLAISVLTPLSSSH